MSEHSGRRITPSELLQWSVLRTATANEDAPATRSDPPPQPQSIDPKWIEVILGKPDAARMKECIEILQNHDKSMEEKLAAFDELELLVESVDNANDLRPLKLWAPLINLLSSEHPQLRSYAAWVIGTALQNNPRAQRDFREEHGVEKLMLLLSDKDNTVRSKAIYAISSAIRHSPSSIYIFATHNGFETLFQTFSNYDHPPALQKTSILLKSLLLNESLESGIPCLVIQHMVQFGFVSTLISVLTHVLTEESNWNESLWEAALACLSAFHTILLQYQNTPSLLTPSATASSGPLGNASTNANSNDVPVVSHSDSHIPDTRQNVLDIVEPTLILDCTVLETTLPKHVISNLHRKWQDTPFAGNNDHAIAPDTRSIFESMLSFSS